MGVISGLITSVVLFVISLVIGAGAIYAGGYLVSGTDDRRKAVWTALFCALGWGLISLVFGWIPVLGGLLVTVLGFAVYVGVINTQYPGDWVEAAAIGFVAWIAARVVMIVLGPLLGVGALGVPWV